MPTDQAARAGLREEVLRLLSRGPLEEGEIATSLKLGKPGRNRLKGVLAKMEAGGQIARIKKSSWCLPEEADLVTGVISFRPSGSAWLAANGREFQVAAENTWVAMHGDTVVARIADPLSAAVGDRREARVIRILQRANTTIVGTLQKSKSFFYVVADDPRFVHNLYVPAPALPLVARPGDKVVAKLEDWNSRHINPEGTVVEVLGPAGAPGVDMLGIIKKHRLPLSFPSDVVTEAERSSKAMCEEESASREDLRSRFILTIDPGDARDFDDAIEVVDNGRGWSVSVHIADVSHFVKPRSALDREAAARGNSVYLVDRVIPMLPEALSNGTCSLRPGEDRYCFSVFAELSRDGKVRKTRFAKSVIHSAKRLTYKEAFKILQAPRSREAVSRALHEAWNCAATLRRRRFEHGSLDLEFPEVKVWLDAQGRPERLERVENDISHQLIEELMLLANECVGRALRLARMPAVYRVHEPPDPERLAEYRELAATYGIRTGDLTNREELVALIEKMKGRPEEYALKQGLLKSLKRARYATDPLGHFGLNKSDYAHFTSPIRRYADLAVHRALERLIGKSKSSASYAELGGVAEHISTTERIAAEAERESVRLKKLEFFQRQVSGRKGQIFKAVVVDVRNFGFFVELPDTLMSGLVHVSSLDDDFYHFEPARMRFIGRRTKKVYRAGDRIDVVVSRVDVFKQQVDFKPA